MSFLFSLLLMMTILPMNTYSLISIRVGSVFNIDVNVNLNNNVEIKINMKRPTSLPTPITIYTLVTF